MLQHLMSTLDSLVNELETSDLLLNISELQLNIL